MPTMTTTQHSATHLSRNVFGRFGRMSSARRAAAVLFASDGLKTKQSHFTPPNRPLGLSAAINKAFTGLAGMLTRKPTVMLACLLACLALLSSCHDDGGYYGLSDVTVAAIPDIYQDVSSVTAAAGDVLANKIIVTAGGAVTPGTMPNNGTVTKTLDTSTTGYTIPAGYHSGSGSEKLVTEEKSVTPTKSSQMVNQTTGKVLAKVTVGAIPTEYITTGDATAVAANLLLGKTAYADGAKITGTMPDTGAMDESFDGLTATSCKVPAGYTSGGTVRLTSDIEDALSTI